MNWREFWGLADISDAELEASLGKLLGAGARLEARIVAHLAEVDARKLHLAMGASSLFDYCLSRLGLSNSEAFHRITAARLASRFPVIFELLERRDVHLTAVCLLRDHLTIENHAGPARPRVAPAQTLHAARPHRAFTEDRYKSLCKQAAFGQHTEMGTTPSLVPAVATLRLDALAEVGFGGQ